VVAPSAGPESTAVDQTESEDSLADSAEDVSESTAVSSMSTEAVSPQCQLVPASREGPYARQR
jgi:hypothetical protein